MESPLLFFILLFCDPEHNPKGSPSIRYDFCPFLRKDGPAFPPVLPALLLQHKINRLSLLHDLQQNVSEKDNKVISEAVCESEQIENRLRTLKKLLDEGILSQEEFDAKKRELLDL